VSTPSGVVERFGYRFATYPTGAVTVQRIGHDDLVVDEYGPDPTRGVTEANLAEFAEAWLERLRERQEPTPLPARPVIVQHLDDGHGRAACTGDPLPRVDAQYDDTPRWACTGCRSKGEIPTARPRAVLHIHTVEPEVRLVPVLVPYPGGGGMLA